MIHEEVLQLAVSTQTEGPDAVTRPWSPHDQRCGPTRRVNDRLPQVRRARCLCRCADDLGADPPAGSQIHGDTWNEHLSVFDGGWRFALMPTEAVVFAH